MSKRSFILSEIAAVFVITAGAVFLWNIYELSGKATMSVILGAVNSSAWEKAKGISVCWFLFGLTELICVKPFFRSYVASKTLGLSVLLAIFLAADSLFGGGFLTDFIVLLIAVIAGVTCTVSVMIFYPDIRRYFAPACFLLLLIFMMTFSFTAFAPRLQIFRDPHTGYYGIIPPSFDLGAVSLNT